MAPFATPTMRPMRLPKQPFRYPPVISGTAHSPKNFGTCTSRCPFVYRSIPKRHAMTGSRLGPLHESRPAPRVSEGWGPGLPVPELPEPFTVSLTFPKGLSSAFLRAPKTPVPARLVSASLASQCTLFPGSLTRKLYIKKIPENALNVTQVSRFLWMHLDASLHTRSGALCTAQLSNGMR